MRTRCRVETGVADTIREPPPSFRVAIIEVADESEWQQIDHETGIDVRWLHRDGADAGTTTLIADAVRTVEMPRAGTPIYAFAGVEAETFKAMR
jgi:NADPH-dependent ferric siderophore reductase